MRLFTKSKGAPFENLECPINPSLVEFSNYYCLDVWEAKGETYTKLENKEGKY